MGTSTLSVSSFSRISRHITLAVLVSIPFCALWIRDSFTIFNTSATYRVLILWLEILYILTFIFFYRRFLPVLSALFKSRLCLLFLLWQISAFVSVLLAPFPWPALIKYLELLSHCAFAWCVYRFISLFPEKRILAVSGIYLAFFYAVLSTLLQWYALDNPQELVWETRLPLFDNIRHFGYFVAAVLPFGFLPLLRSEKKEVLAIFKWVVSSFILTICWAIVFWQGGRGCLVSTVSAILLLLWLIKDKKIVVICIGIFSLSLGFILSNNFKLNSQVPVLSRMNITKAEQNSPGAWHKSWRRM